MHAVTNETVRSGLFSSPLIKDRVAAAGAGLPMVLRTVAIEGMQPGSAG